MLPLSIADTLPKAFAEWRFTGLTHDHDEIAKLAASAGRKA